MGTTVVFDGELELLVCEDGECGEVIAIREGYPEYTGPRVITPTEETQTLATANKSVLENIVVEPIPTNYGRIEWNGSVLRVY